MGDARLYVARPIGCAVEDRKRKMTLKEAISLIEPGIPADTLPQHWADLGCGNGTFTQALAHLLAHGSSITAVDRSPQQIGSFIDTGVTVQFKQLDFEGEDFYLPMLNGILMANSFHYIQKKESLIKRLERCFHKAKQFLIIEYETDSPNPWVPYPIGFDELAQLFDGLGYGTVTKLKERQSSYGGKMYAALIK